MPSIILPNNNLKAKIENLRHNAIKRSVVCTAFCQSKMFETIFCQGGKVLPEQRLLMRWSLEDLVKGVSDLDTYFCAVNNGWDVYINLNLHAKCYVFDTVSVIGSANLTKAGLSNYDNGNIELCVIRENDHGFLGWVYKVFSESTRLTDELVMAIERDVDRNKQDHQMSPPSFSSETISQIYDGIEKFEIYTSELPWSINPACLTKVSDGLESFENRNHDISLFAVDSPTSLEQLRRQFMQSKSWKWLIHRLQAEKYFGELAQMLHQDLSDDPTPYRKDVKTLLQNLMTWAENLVPELIEIDQPGRKSKRIYLKF